MLSSLKIRTMRNVSYVGMSQLMTLLLSLGTVAVLARILTPNDFGIVVIGMVLLNLFCNIQHFVALPADHRRYVSKLEHLISDYERDVGDDGLTHLGEILDMHDISMDPECGSLEEFVKRSSSNINNRCIHQHVFDTRLTARMIEQVGFRILVLVSQSPYHIIALCQRPVLRIEDREPDKSGAS